MKIKQHVLTVEQFLNEGMNLSDTARMNFIQEVQSVIFKHRRYLEPHEIIDGLESLVIMYTEEV